MKHKKILSAVFLASAMSFPVQAAIPTVDMAAIAKAVEQLRAWGQQYAQMGNLIMQAQEAHRAMTGDRGMANLLPGNRSYLPPDWNNAMTALSAEAQRIKTTQTVLTPQQFAALSPQMQQFNNSTRNVSAAQQAAGQAAYNEAAARVVRLQGLTNALVGQTDPAAVMQLTARIQSEQAGLANDQAQLQALAQLTAAQSHAQRQMENELRVQTSGSGNNMPRLNTALPF